MEIRIGIKEAPRELVVASGQSADEVEKLVSELLTSAEGVLRLADDKGRKYLIPTDRIAYVEITPAEARKIGFATG